MKHQYKPLALLSLMFFMVGSLFCMNDILLPSLITHFDLNYTQATMIQFTFYLTYIVFPIPIAWMIHRFGYKISLLVAVLTCSFGASVFWPAKIFDSYALVLLAIFIISKKFTMIQTTFLSWFVAFVMMWVTIGNLGVLPYGLLLFAVPLSLFESFIATVIIKYRIFRVNK